MDDPKATKGPSSSDSIDSDTTWDFLARGNNEIRAPAAPLPDTEQVLVTSEMQQLLALAERNISSWENKQPVEIVAWTAISLSALTSRGLPLIFRELRRLVDASPLADPFFQRQRNHWRTTNPSVAKLPAADADEWHDSFASEVAHAYPAFVTAAINVILKNGPSKHIPNDLLQRTLKNIE